MHATAGRGSMVAIPALARVQDHAALHEGAPPGIGCMMDSMSGLAVIMSGSASPTHLFGVSVEKPDTANHAASRRRASLQSTTTFRHACNPLRPPTKTIVLIIPYGCILLKSIPKEMTHAPYL